MQNIDTSKRFVVVLLSTLDAGRASNVCGHLCLGLVAKAAHDRPGLLPEMSFVDYPDADGGSHTPISALGLIVLSAKAPWLIKLRQQLTLSEILFTDYLSTMTEGSFADQQARTAQVRANDLEYLGIAMFGPRSALDPLTKRFSLWK